MAERRNKDSTSGWWCGACQQPYVWRKPNRLLTLQIGDTANEQVVLMASGPPDGERDSMTCALKLAITTDLRRRFAVVHRGGHCKSVRHHR